MEIGAISTQPGSSTGGPTVLKEPAGSILPVRATDAEPGVQGEPIAERQSGRALEIFRQELNYALYAKLGLKLAAERPVYDAVKTALTAGDIATDTLGTASRVVAENPDVSSRALIRFRQSVQAAAAYTRETVGGDDDIDGLEDALGKLDGGLDELDEETSRNVRSEASVLSVDTRLRQRSTIRIRTQEGDVVRLDLRRAERLSAEDVAVADERGLATRTEVSLSSRSRFTLSVRGDLSEAEFAAIRGVFVQAEAVADEFFGGDLSAAFALASNLEIDTEQLARVNLRFRSQEVSSVAFARIGDTRTDAEPPSAPIAARLRPVAPPGTPPGVNPVLDDPRPAAPASDSPSGARTASPAAAAPAANSADTDTPVAARTVDTAGAVDDGPVVDAAAGPVDLAFSDLPFLRFFEMLAEFLSSVAKGFERQANEASTSLRYHYSESFKLQILKSVIEVAAPEDSLGAARFAGTLIDGLVEAGEAEQADG